MFISTSHLTAVTRESFLSSYLAHIEADMSLTQLIQSRCTIQINFSFTSKVFLRFLKSMTEFLTTLTTEESIDDDETTIGRSVTDGNSAADPFLGRKHGADYDECPKAREKAR